MKPVNRQAVVDEARSWIGTPWREHGRVKNVGADCAGLPLGIAWDLGLNIPDFKEYVVEPAPGVLKTEMDKRLDRISIVDLQPGDLLCFRWVERLQHIGVWTGSTVIHAKRGRGVVEHRMNERWCGYVGAVYRYRGLG